ncbi:SusE domain-containing protein [Olivibacter sp. SDN3]|uniref:SusE domain-containing protein n=1 Tax=Olivibacter sp. SDN3 TaxID=2764720 RepID=UPI0016518616|nr:SusE domain-containing protein [Olivibacter sp. SDN3]QNL49371.1 SusE domain-containing protein [Olivibacter sp. SDN3]
MNLFIKHPAYLLAILALLLTACSKEKSLNTEVSEVTTLFAPKNDAFIKLGQGSIQFEWEMARAADNGLVIYEVLFDREDGDFSEPLYSSPSEGNGMQRILTLDHGVINRIAETAGIGPLETGAIKWSVVSSKGVNVQAPVAVHTLVIERPAGFTSVPTELYLTGSAAEGGGNLDNAPEFKQISNGIYEIYTKLGDGTYQFIDAQNENANSYFIDNTGIIQAGGENSHAGEHVYRIRLNFNNATSSMTEITNVSLWFAPDDRFWFDLPYTQNGTWEIKGADIIFKQEDWGRDERYKFRFMVKNATGEDSEEWYGSSNADNSRPTSSTPASYWHMVLVDNDRWQNCFKFDGDVDNSKADIKIDFNSSVEEYTHQVTSQ